MTTERLYEFTILANTLSFSKAAGKLYITQSVLSRHIIEMEKELGVSLFIRNTHGVTLTDAGKILLRNTQTLIRKTDETTTLLHSFKLEADGTVHIACSEQTLCTPVQEFLKQFLKKYPNIVLKIEPITGGTSQEHLYHYDLYFTPCEFSNNFSEHISKSFLMSQSALVAVPPRHPFGADQFISLSELKNESLLVPFSDELFGPYAQNALLAEKYTGGHINRISVPTSQAALLMVELGQGIAIIPHHLKSQVYKHTRTVPVLNPECRFDIFLYHNTQTDNAAANLFYKSALNFFAQT